MEQNIILLFGGDSDERLVSVASAQAMAEAITPKKLWFWHRNGPVYQVTNEELQGHKNPFTNEFIPHGEPVFVDIESSIKSPESHGFVFLLGLHGGRGENGYVQEILERHHRPFTGSGSRASAVAFNKIATKEALKPLGIKMAPHIIIESKDRESIQQNLKSFFDSYCHIIVKPICGGSSLGCFFIRDLSDISHAASEMAKQNRIFMAEKIIYGREVTLGVVVIDGQEKPLVGTEIVLDANRSFDYEGKYLGAGTQEITPARISEQEMREAQRIAVLAHRGLHLRGYSRTDLILAEDGFYYLETNTLPGMSRSSLVPQQLALAGISLRQFLMNLIKEAQQS